MGYLRTYLKTRRGRRIGIALGMGVAVWMLVRCSSHPSAPTLVYIPEGNATLQRTALTAQGFALARDDLQKPLDTGWVRLGNRTPPEGRSLVETLRAAAREKTRRVVMYSGETIHLFAEHLAAQTHLPKGKLLNAYYRYAAYSDGGILAGYYQVPYNTTPEATMFSLVRRSRQAFRSVAQTHRIPYRTRTFKNYLIVASIIQKETWHTDEMPRIASVIYNRLQKGQKLQLDATLNYGPYAHTPVTPERIRTDESHFNTYRYAGLPPEPIGSVSRAALDAAMAPAQTDYYYFVLDPKGWHDFSAGYTQHLEKIRRYKTQKKKKTTQQ